MTDTLITWALTNVILPLAGTILLALLSKLALVINKKFNLEIQRTTIEHAVQYAEQMAEKAIKDNQSTLTSSQKLTKAVEYVNKAIPGQDQERVKQRIEAAVQRVSQTGREMGCK
jgi:asparagine synthetase B (glutamine-hydrolysing)